MEGRALIAVGPDTIVVKECEKGAFLGGVHRIAFSLQTEGGQAWLFEMLQTGWRVVDAFFSLD